VKDEFIFYPPIRWGLIVHVIGALLLISAGGYGLWQAFHATIGPSFLIFLIPSLLALGLAAWLIYRGYALRGAHYILERDGLRLHWGLRLEDIPMDTVVWVRQAEDLESRLPLPWLRIPGSVLGSRNLTGIGDVEFFASSWHGIVLIATSERIYAISPQDPQVFLSSFQRFMELGSLSPLPARSVYPTILLTRVWQARLARYTILLGLGFSLLLLIGASLAIPGRDQISLGFTSSLEPRDPIPAVRLMLLPVLNGFFFLADFLLGLFFFRQDENQSLSYLVWGGGALTALLFLLGMIIVLQVG
jgi:hypothetical protein